MRTVLRKINKAGAYIAAFFLCILLFLTAADVISRNVFNYIILGGFELTQMLLSMIIFMGAAYTQDCHEHVCIEIMYNAFPRAGKWFVSLLSTLIVLAMGFVATYYMYIFASTQIGRGEITMTLGLPLWPISVVATVGMAFFTLTVIVDLIFVIKDKGVLGLVTN